MSRDIVGIVARHGRAFRATSSGVWRVIVGPELPGFCATAASRPATEFPPAGPWQIGSGGLFGAFPVSLKPSGGRRRAELRPINSAWGNPCGDRPAAHRAPREGRPLAVPAVSCPRLQALPGSFRGLSRKDLHRRGRPRFRPPDLKSGGSSSRFEPSFPIRRRFRQKNRGTGLAGASPQALPPASRFPSALGDRCSRRGHPRQPERAQWTEQQSASSSPP
jgi:hypothetical protein